MFTVFTDSSPWHGSVFLCVFNVTDFKYFGGGAFSAFMIVRVLKRGETGNDMQQRTTGRIQTQVGCGKDTTIIHGAPTLTTVLLLLLDGPVFYCRVFYEEISIVLFA